MEDSLPAATKMKLTLGGLFTQENSSKFFGFLQRKAGELEDRNGSMTIQEESDVNDSDGVGSKSNFVCFNKFRIQEVCGNASFPVQK
jgi:hypothetical protein